MLSDRHIKRHFEAQDHGRLIGCLAENGTAMPLMLQARLTQSVAATGLGLRRLVELTYGPTVLSREMTAVLLDGQVADGSFQGTSGRDPLATAAAVAGLTAVLREHHGRDTQDCPELADALDRGLASLGGMQMEDGLFCHGDDRTIEDRALTSAFVLFLLARLPGFREAIRFADLMTWFDERADRLDDETLELYQMASLDDPARHPRIPRTPRIPHPAGSGMAGIAA
jgi:hypothetical protein